ncbi:MAG TPA: hypothetical protein VFF06_31655 [Polyangia bacterium]|nr:hypothetical protein [Polyangia bacterium]
MRFPKWILFVVATSGCYDAYVVNQADLERVAVPARGAGWVVPATREDGTRVLVHTATLAADEAFLRARREATSPSGCFERADAFQLAGRFKEAAAQLRLCLGYVAQPGVEISDENQTQVKDAIQRLEEGDGANVEIRALAIAAACLGGRAPGVSPSALSALNRSREVLVRASNRLQTAGLVLALSGGVTVAIAGIAAGALSPGCGSSDRMGCLGTVVIGGMLGTIGAVPLLTGIVLALAGIHYTEASPSFVARHEPRLSDPIALAAYAANARRMVIGGGVSTAVSFIAVAVGAGLAANYGALTPQNPSAPQKLAAGQSLLGIGVIGSIPSVAVLIVGLTQSARMPRAATASVAPWFTGQAGGLAITGRF